MLQLCCFEIFAFLLPCFQTSKWAKRAVQLTRQTVLEEILFLSIVLYCLKLSEVVADFANFRSSRTLFCLSAITVLFHPFKLFLSSKSSANCVAYNAVIKSMFMSLKSIYAF